MNLHFIWIIGCSDSMQGTKIESLNFAIREWAGLAKELARKDPRVQILVRAITYSDGAQWHVERPTPIDVLTWMDIQAGGNHDMGLALSLAAAELTVEQLGQVGIPPVIVLVSDGSPSDDFCAGVTDLMSQPWGKAAVRLAIAIGDDADVNALQRFIDNPEIKPLSAQDAFNLMDKIKWTEINL